MTDTPPLWAIVPTIDLVDLTLQTVEDLLAQSTPVRVLLVDQGSSEPSNDAFRACAEQSAGRVWLWSFTPPLPSLSAVWNAALRFVWAQGHAEALVVNSDVRLHRETACVLRGARLGYDALFVTAVGVGADQFDPEVQYDANAFTPQDTPVSVGGPDFSCYLITSRGHWKYPFDEGFIPAYGEDCDLHRRYMLGGDGARIFSVNLPFHHIRGGSRTVNQSPEARARFEHLRGIGAAHYVAKWGGAPNQERFLTPYGKLGVHGFDGVTNPELQARVQAGEPVLSGRAAVSADMDRCIEQMLAEADRALTGPEAITAVEAAFTQKARGLRGET